MEKLSITERDELLRLEGVFERGVSAWFEAANSMHEIAARKLYRETHESFKDYCKARWNLQEASVRRLIKSAKSVEALVVTGLPQPPSANQADQLARLPADKANLAWRNALEVSKGKPTGAIVKAEVEKLLPPSPQRGARAAITSLFLKIGIALTPEDLEHVDFIRAGRKISRGAYFRELVAEDRQRLIKSQREHEARVAAA